MQDICGTADTSRSSCVNVCWSLQTISTTHDSVNSLFPECLQRVDIGTDPNPGSWRHILTPEFVFALYFHHATCRCNLIAGERRNSLGLSICLRTKCHRVCCWDKVLLFSALTPSHLPSKVINIYLRFFATALHHLQVFITETFQVASCLHIKQLFATKLL
jgi:hypothetical protein